MKTIYLKKNVLDAARDRIRWIFDEFENVVASVSGGKDSTVIWELTLEIAREKGRLPLRTLFVDQEAEWSYTIDIMRYMMSHPDVEPWWYQIPIKIENSSTFESVYQNCWGVGEEWLRPKEEDPRTIKENTYGFETWSAGMFGKIAAKDFPNQKTAFIAGVRAEEAPKRRVGLTSTATYKHVTWGAKLTNKGEYYTLYPLYDWSYTDIWKAIHEYKWVYNKVYDYFYMYGVKTQQMRVSNLHHETAINSLFIVQEIDADVYSALTKRMKGIDAAGKIGKKDFFPKELPYMFKSWKEYRDYLLPLLLQDEKEVVRFRNKFEKLDKRYAEIRNPDDLHAVQVASIIANDVMFTKMTNWERRPSVWLWRKYWEKGCPVKNGAMDEMIKRKPDGSYVESPKAKEWKHDPRQD